MSIEGLRGFLRSGMYVGGWVVVIEEERIGL